MEFNFSKGRGQKHCHTIINEIVNLEIQSLRQMMVWASTIIPTIITIIAIFNNYQSDRVFAYCVYFMLVFVDCI